MLYHIAAVLLALCLAVSEQQQTLSSPSSRLPYQFVEEWNLWKSTHNRQYSNESVELQRHYVWLDNKKYIEQHNMNEAEERGFTLAMNQFADLTSEEYRELHGCYNAALDNSTDVSTSDRVRPFESPRYFKLPETVDWRTKDAVSPVQNQGQCGACFAFSAVGALEGVYALAHDKLVPLSTQNVIDCSVPYGNHGCNGGTVMNAFQYVIDSDGVDSAEAYPYKGRQGQCKFNKSFIGATSSGVVTITSGSESDLQVAVATAGPVSISIDATSNAFRFYSGGILDEPNCSNTKLTHSMLIIGYGVYKEKNYWLVKNSWGTDWGLNGYIMMARHKSNQCGIATAAAFPTL